MFLLPPRSQRSGLLGPLIRTSLLTFRIFRRHCRLKEEWALVEASGLFDKAWYLAGNPDVDNAHTDPLRHYLLHGAFEARDPSSQFRSQWYLGTYDDVRRSGINPLVHYLKYGTHEMRQALPEMATEQAKNSADGIRLPSQMRCRTRSGDQ